MAMQHKQEDGTKLVVHRLVSRRKLKKSYEYEVEWQNTSPDRNTWIPRDKCAPPLLFLHMPTILLLACMTPWWYSTPPGLIAAV